MVGATSLAFPGSRTLASWWRQLAPYRPCAMGVGYLFIHRVEALAACRQARPLEPLSRMVLHALALCGQNSINGQASGQPDLLDRLNQRLHLGRQVVRQSLCLLETQALVRQEPSNFWFLTELGKNCLARAEVPTLRYQRRVFPFVEILDNTGHRRQPPHFVPLCECPGIPWHLEDDNHFALALLSSCFGQPSSWKNLWQFPEEIVDIVLPGKNDVPFPQEGPPLAIPPEWQRLVVDRPLRVLTALIRSGLQGKPLQIFAARQEGWILLADTPLATLSHGWHDFFPAMTESNLLELGHHAWWSWGQQRGLSVDELQASTLAVDQEAVKVNVPAHVLERLHSDRHDVLKGETWILGEAGQIRPAFRLDIHSR